MSEQATFDDHGGIFTERCLGFAGEGPGHNLYLQMEQKRAVWSRVLSYEGGHLMIAEDENEEVTDQSGYELWCSSCDKRVPYLGSWQWGE